MLPVAEKTEIQIYQTQASFLDSDFLFRGFVGGRGCGKTFIGAYDLLKRAKPRRLYMAIAPTYTMLKDASWRSFVQIAQQLRFVRDVNKSDLRITLGNGAEVLFRSGDEPDRLRGPNLSGVWLDEASVMEQGVYEISIASLREAGEQGWLSATFTPKGRQHWTYRVFGQARPDTALFHAKTLDNPFLPAELYDVIRRQYTSFMAQQELEGRFVENVEGALWRLGWIDDARVSKAPLLQRIVVAIDPAGTHKPNSDQTGIAVCGKGEDGHWYVLHCLGYRLSPQGWASKAVALYDEYQADRLIVERNNGGEMVETTIRSIRRSLPITTIVASRGKALRAEPIAALYERGEVHHVGKLTELEEQLCAFPIANEHDDMCLASGTLIDTKNGPVPIEQITVGTLVLTRQGYKKVIASGQTNPNADLVTLIASNGMSLTGTRNHSVFVIDKGFTNLDALCYSDILETSCQIGEGWCIEKQLSSMIFHFIGILNRHIESTGIISDHTSITRCRAFKHFIRKSGRLLLALFLRDISSITRIRTRSIIKSIIWNASLLLGMQHIIPAKPMLVTNSGRTWRESAHWHLSGINQKRVERGIANTARRHLRIDNQLTECVSNVALHTNHYLAGRVIGSVPANAPLLGEGILASITKGECVLPANKASRSVNTRRISVAPVNALGLFDAGKGPVYNLSVESPSEYFANGILVHNCDALVYALTELSEDKAIPSWWLPKEAANA